MQCTMKSLAIKIAVDKEGINPSVNTSLRIYIIRSLLAILLICGLGIIPLKAQQVNVAELDTEIQKLEASGDKEGKELKGLYYDSHPTIFIKADVPTPIIAGKGKAKVANIHVSKTKGLDKMNIDLSAVKLLILSFEGLRQVGGYQFKKEDFETFTSLEYIVILSDVDVDSSNIKAMFSNMGEDSHFYILYKSLTEKY